jgi:hypothetical protein
MCLGASGVIYHTLGSGQGLIGAAPSLLIILGSTRMCTLLAESCMLSCESRVARAVHTLALTEIASPADTDANDPHASMVGIVHVRCIALVFDFAVLRSIIEKSGFLALA